MCVHVWVLEEGRDVKSWRSVTNCMSVCVCVYGCALCGVTGKRKIIEMWRKKWETWFKKQTKKSCYSVWPARALRINLAGVTVPDHNWRDIEDPYFPEWFMSRPWKGLRFIQRQTSLFFCFLEWSQKFSSTRGQICYTMSNVFDSQFEFCRAVKGVSIP